MQDTSLKILKAPGDATGVGVAVFEVDPSNNFGKMTAPARFMQDSNIIHDIELFSIALLAASVSNYVWFCHAGVWQVDHVVADQVAAGGAGATVTVTVCTPTTAIGSGTVQLTGAIDLATAGNNARSVRGVVIASPTRIAAGDRVGIVMAGTLTNLVGNLTVGLKRVA